MWIREELDTESLPNWYEEINDMIDFYKKKHLWLFLSEASSINIDFEEFEFILKEELNTLYSQNLSFLNNEFPKDNEDSKRLIMIINKVQLYWEDRIKEIMDDLKNPKQKVGIFKSLIAKILN
jgi:hypothetical protein